MSNSKAPLTSANSVPRQLLQSVLARTLAIAPPLSEPLCQVGDLAGYARWKRARLMSHGRPLFSHRERLWKAIRPTLMGKTDLIVLEFGVAWGYATSWWLQALPSPGLEWHGFDTFTGLPTNWSRADRDVKGAGAFSASGNPPPIDDPRVRWHVGDAVLSLKALELPARSRPKFVIFDMDLGAPTHACLEILLDVLAPGDVLYFDEAFDSWNERKVIDDLLLPNFQVTCLGSTATALAVTIEKRVD
jgi:hypothetical protein